MVLKSSLKATIAIAALMMTPLAASAHSKPKLIRACHFDAPDQDEDCKAKIITCLSVPGTDEEMKACRNNLTIKCGGHKVFSGPYTESREDDSIRVTAGNPAPLGAPYIIHGIPGDLPTRVDASLTIGDVELSGSCFVRQIGSDSMEN